ncbi:DUF6090 family protein [uncultured Kordia sp.]|uniref:DUF6090 family protein n=1 Tax=uncultured Kordia sp. TaxID=507699 RepID=UPI00261D002D|nr:DUF6090 family protein [uncultured Kordia sp.]
MLKIFRSVRKRLLKDNKFKSYILYAIGEILLVMIGILLALQVNNWNERRKTKIQLNNTLSTIVNDLALDTLVAHQIIKYYEINQKNSLRVINKEITLDNYRECPSCASLITIYKPFNIQTKGYDLLKKITSSQANKKDSLLTDLSQLYSLFIPTLEKSNDRLENDVLKNLESFKEHDWFVDWTQQKFNQDMIAYFSTSEDYRKKVAAHNLLASKNHLLIVTSYKANAKVMLEKIKERLESD